MTTPASIVRCANDAYAMTTDDVFTMQVDTRAFDRRTRASLLAKLWDASFDATQTEHHTLVVRKAKAVAGAADALGYLPPLVRCVVRAALVRLAHNSQLQLRATAWTDADRRLLADVLAVHGLDCVATQYTDVVWKLTITTCPIVVTRSSQADAHVWVQEVGEEEGKNGKAIFCCSHCHSHVRAVPATARYEQMTNLFTPLACPARKGHAHSSVEPVAIESKR